MQRISVYCTLHLIAVLLLTGCGAGPAAPSNVAADDRGLVSQIISGELDGQTVTLQGIYYQRGESRLLVPALSLSAPGGPTPLLVSPLEALRLSRGIDGELRRVEGVAFAPVRVTGKVVATEAGRILEVQSSKLIEPVVTSLDLLKSGGFSETIVEVEGALLSRPGSLLLASEIGAGGVPESGAAQVKLVAPLPDEALLARLQTSSDSQVRYGPVRAVGLYSGGALHLLWAESR